MNRSKEQSSIRKLNEFIKLYEEEIYLNKVKSNEKMRSVQDFYTKFERVIDMIDLTKNYFKRLIWEEKEQSQDSNRFDDNLFNQINSKFDEIRHFLFQFLAGKKLKDTDSIDQDVIDQSFNMGVESEFSRTKDSKISKDSSRRSMRLSDFLFKEVSLEKLKNYRNDPNEESQFDEYGQLDYNCTFGKKTFVDIDLSKFNKKFNGKESKRKVLKEELRKFINKDKKQREKKIKELCNLVQKKKMESESYLKSLQDEKILKITEELETDRESKSTHIKKKDKRKELLKNKKKYNSYDFKRKYFFIKKENEIQSQNELEDLSKMDKLTHTTSPKNRNDMNNINGVETLNDTNEEDIPENQNPVLFIKSKRYPMSKSFDVKNPHNTEVKDSNLNTNSKNEYKFRSSSKGYSYNWNLGNKDINRSFKTSGDWKSYLDYGKNRDYKSPQTKNSFDQTPTKKNMNYYESKLEHLKERHQNYSKYFEQLSKSQCRSEIFKTISLENDKLNHKIKNKQYNSIENKRK